MCRTVNPVKTRNVHGCSKDGVLLREMTYRLAMTSVINQTNKRASRSTFEKSGEDFCAMVPELYTRIMWVAIVQTDNVRKGETSIPKGQLYYGGNIYILGAYQRTADNGSQDWIDT